MNVGGVKMKKASTGGIFEEKVRAQLTDPNNVGVTAPELFDVDALEVDGDGLVVTLSTTRARKPCSSAAACINRRWVGSSSTTRTVFAITTPSSVDGRL